MQIMHETFMHASYKLAPNNVLDVYHVRCLGPDEFSNYITNATKTTGLAQFQFCSCRNSPCLRHRRSVNCPHGSSRRSIHCSFRSSPWLRASDSTAARTRTTSSGRRRPVGHIGCKFPIITYAIDFLRFAFPWCDFQSLI